MTWTASRASASTHVTRTHQGSARTDPAKPRCPLPAHRNTLAHYSTIAKLARMPAVLKVLGCG